VQSKATISVDEYIKIILVHTMGTTTLSGGGLKKGNI
jgi:hypothetical protein